MADILRIKRRTTGVAGAPASLANAELAYNETDHVLYYGEGTGGTGGTASVIVGIAGQGLASTAAPLMDGVASPGIPATSTWSKSDHVHPTDTSRAPLASPAFTGTPTLVTPPVTGDSSSAIATTSFVKAQGYATGGAVPTPSSSTPAVDVTGGAVGLQTTVFARGDHAHPTDTSRAPVAGPSFTGLVSIGGTIGGVGMTAWSAAPGPIGATTPSSGAFTTLSATSTVSGAGFTTLLAPYALVSSVPLINTLTTPIVDGAAAIGTLTTYARSDHIHPTDGSRAPIAAPSFTGLVSIGGTIGGAGMTAWSAAPGPIGSTTASTGAFTTLSASSTVSGAGFTALLSPYALASSVPIINTVTTPLADGAAAIGTLTTYARPDHVHPTDISRAALNSPAFTGTPTLVTAPLATDNSSAVATTAFVKAQSYALSGSVPTPSITTPSVDAGAGAIGTFSTYARADHAHPTDTSRAATAGPTFTGAVNISGSIGGTGMSAWAASPTAIGSATPSTGAFTSLSATSTVSGAGFTSLLAPYALLTTRLDQFAAPNVDVSMNTFKLTGLGPPVNGTDAATKAYVDANATGLSAKGSVACGTVGANITLSGLQTIDGYTTLANDRVLVKDQTATAANGIYVASSTAWVRATDMDAWGEVPQAYVFVINGTVNSASSWVCNSPVAGTIGTTAITWVQFSQQAQVTAGGGLTRTGNSFDVIGTANRISVFADNIDIAATYVGQTSITTLGAIATGTWNATTVAVNHGGSGATALTGFLVGNGTSPFTAVATIPNTSITGLGSMASQNANAVAITGGTIDGVTLDGGSF